MFHAKKIGMLSLVLLLAASQVFAGDHDPKHIIPLLKDSKMTLLSGIEYAEKTSGVATSAKFEVNDEGKLELSVYTVPEGLEVEPETATLTEVSGSANGTFSELKTEIFADKEHIARSSVHMTLFQISKLSLKEVILRAQQFANGVAIDVKNPKVLNKRPVAEVVVVNEKQDFSIVMIDLLSGKVIR